MVIDFFDKDKMRSSMVFDKILGNTYQGGDELILLKIPEYFFRETEKEKFLDKIKKFESFREITEFVRTDCSIQFNSDLLTEINKNSQIQNWIDIEVLYYDTLISLFKKNSGKPNLENILREYNYKFNILKTKLIEYLRGLKIDFESCDVNFYLSNFFEKSLLNDGDDSPVDNVMFLNFNYTKSIESLKRFYFRSNGKFKINHIHGSLDDLETVIFGFGDEYDEEYIKLKSNRSKELFKNIKRFHYSQEDGYPEMKSFLGSGDYEVYIVGHSCGISDRTILNEIFSNSSCKSIRIFHFRKDKPRQEFHEKSIEILKYYEGEKGTSIISTFNKEDVMFQLNCT